MSSESKELTSSCMLVFTDESDWVLCCTYPGVLFPAITGSFTSRISSADCVLLFGASSMLFFASSWSTDEWEFIALVVSLLLKMLSDFSRIGGDCVYSCIYSTSFLTEEITFEMIDSPIFIRRALYGFCILVGDSETWLEMMSMLDLGAVDRLCMTKGLLWRRFTWSM